MVSEKDIEIVVAVDEDGGFGKGGKIPWHYKEDFRRFQKLTKGHICVMGRRTYEDILEMRKERDKNKKKQIIKEILPNRRSFVLTSDPNFEAPGATKVKSLSDAIHTLKLDDDRKIFILGGERLYRESLTWAKKVHLTLIPGQHQCDRFFPVGVLNTKFEITAGEKYIPDSLYFVTYTRKR